ncbi:MAG: beta-ketoacyl-ACP synthase I [Chromatiales bacterium]|jgi:3-oxoacyl-[acyl-carrier-protein] synthase-1|nr:beta-ketoacyl-ACP synthase I [Chromatiales bacterium]
MRRVVITGLGIVSNIGTSAAEVDASLRAGRSGIRYSEKFAELGLRSRVHGPIDVDLAANIDRRLLRFMGDAAAFCYLSTRQAIEDAGLTPEEVSHPRTGVVLGSGGASNSNFLQAADALRSRGIKGVGPYMVTRTMGSTTSANIATAFKIKGVNYSISSACSTSAHCIGHACELVQFGKQDIVLAGGGEEVDWTMAMLFDGMGALSSKYNDTPERASRPYDLNRDGFVIAGGAGVVVVESLEHAQARGARIYAEITGYGATSDGADMVAPSGEGAVRCMQQALSTVEGPIDYINAHGTATQAGDIKELEAVRTVFGDRFPPISSTKSLTGHALGAAGVNEAIYSLLMMKGNYIAASANIENLDPGAEGAPIVRTLRENVSLRQVMSNSFGFGGTNATLVFSRLS